MEKLQLSTHDTITRANSAFASGFPFPISEKSKQNKPILVTVDRVGDGDSTEGKVEREIQRIVAAHRFHGSQFPIQNTVMIEASDPVSTRALLHESAQCKYSSCSVRSVWIAKVLAILSVRRNPLTEVGVMTRTSTVSEVALVQYFDVCEENADEIEEHLGCTKLRWSQYGCPVADKADIRRYFDILDVSTIRGLVHVVRGDYGLGISETHSCEGDRHWTKQWFYINRFKLERRGAKMFIDEQP